MNPSPAAGNSIRGGVLAALGLAVLVIVTFGRCASFDYCGYDDQLFVTDNAYVLRPSKSDVVRLWIAPFEGLYAPVGFMLYMGISAAAQRLGLVVDGLPDPRAFHAVAVVLQALVAVLALTMFQRMGLRRRSAWVAAAVYALHPLQVESVAWIAGLHGLLAMALALAATIVYLGCSRDAAHAVNSRRTGTFRYVAATALYALAVLSKPIVVPLPAILVVVAVACRRRLLSKSLATMLPWLAIALAVTLLTQCQQSGEVLVDRTPAAWRPLVALDALGFYLGKLVWPLPLSPDYGRTPQQIAAQWRDHRLTIAAPIVLLVALVVCRPPKFVWIACAAFGLALAPVLGLVPFAHQNISTVADRYMQLALLAPAAIAGWLLGRSSGKLTPALAAALVAACAAASWYQVAIWRNADTLTRHVLSINPASWMMASVRAGYLENLGRSADSQALYEEAARRSPQAPSAHINLAQWRSRRGDHAGAAESFRKAVDLVPGHSRLLNSLGGELAALGRRREAIDCYRQAVTTDPKFVMAWTNLGQVLDAEGRTAEALSAFENAVRAKPRDPILWARVSDFQMALGQLPQAEASLRNAMALDPAAPQPKSKLAGLLLALGRRGEAIELLRAAAAQGDAGANDELRRLGSTP